MNYKITTILKACLLSGLCSVLVCSCSNKGGRTLSTDLQIKNFTQYVDPRIGTGDHGHVFLGADVPFGLVQLGPTNISEGWDWTSGYHVSDSTIYNFGHMHLSGTGIGDLGDIGLMPVDGPVKLAKGTPKDITTGMYSKFKHSSEKIKAGYYSVHLDRYNVDAEMTATSRVGFSKYTFHNAKDARIVIDLEHGIGWDQPVQGKLVQENDSVVSGYRYSTGWSKDQRIYFTAVFSKPFKKFIFSDAKTEKTGREMLGKVVYGEALFDTKGDESIYVKVALSPISIENAKLNMKSELPNWDFNKTVADADALWNKELSKIKIQTSDDKIKRIFYTSLYHTMIAPAVYCDVNKDYLGTDKKVHTGNTFTNYTIFSLWDSYRAAFPLFTLIHPNRENDVINTMLSIYKEQGCLPVWPLMGSETYCMVGNPAIPIIADAILKGYTGFDKNLAYEAMKTTAMKNDRGLDLLKKYGYIPCDKENEAVAKGLEYALADGAIAAVAKEMGKTDDYNYFLKRSKSYQYYFDKSSRFMRGLTADGKFRTPFDPIKSVHRNDDYTEGNAWQYTWLVPHDVKGLIGLFSTKQQFTQKLDSLFIVQGSQGKDASPDISGLIGQYAQGNEPSHHILYLYTYAGQPAKAANLIRRVLTTLYNDKPAGLCGNEDVGQMSSWYILSSLGFYQVNPAGGQYVFGSPLIDRAELQVQGGKTFTIIAKNNSPENKYIQSVTLNGKPYDKYYIDYKDIVSGPTLEFTMGNKPSQWGTDIKL